MQEYIIQIVPKNNKTIYNFQFTEAVNRILNKMLQKKPSKSNLKLNSYKIDTQTLQNSIRQLTQMKQQLQTTISVHKNQEQQLSLQNQRLRQEIIMLQKKTIQKSNHTQCQIKYLKLESQLKQKKKQLQRIKQLLEMQKRNKQLLSRQYETKLQKSFKHNQILIDKYQQRITVLTVQLKQAKIGFDFANQKCNQLRQEKNQVQAELLAALQTRRNAIVSINNSRDNSQNNSNNNSNNISRNNSQHYDNNINYNNDYNNSYNNNYHDGYNNGYNQYNNVEQNYSQNYNQNYNSNQQSPIGFHNNSQSKMSHSSITNQNQGSNYNNSVQKNNFQNNSNSSLKQHIQTQRLSDHHTNSYHSNNVSLKSNKSGNSYNNYGVDNNRNNQSQQDTINKINIKIGKQESLNLRTQSQNQSAFKNIPNKQKQISNSSSSNPPQYNTNNSIKYNIPKSPTNNYNNSQLKHSKTSHQIGSSSKQNYNYKSSYTDSYLPSMQDQENFLAQMRKLYQEVKELGLSAQQIKFLPPFKKMTSNQNPSRKDIEIFFKTPPIQQKDNEKIQKSLNYIQTTLKQKNGYVSGKQITQLIISRVQQYENSSKLNTQDLQISDMTPSKSKSSSSYVFKQESQSKFQTPSYQYHHQYQQKAGSRASISIQDNVIHQEEPSFS